MIQSSLHLTSPHNKPKIFNCQFERQDSNIQNFCVYSKYKVGEHWKTFTVKTGRLVLTCLLYTYTFIFTLWIFRKLIFFFFFSQCIGNGTWYTYVANGEYNSWYSHLYFWYVIWSIFYLNNHSHKIIMFGNILLSSNIVLSYPQLILLSLDLISAISVHTSLSQPVIWLGAAIIGSNEMGRREKVKVCCWNVITSGHTSTYCVRTHLQSQQAEFMIRASLQLHNVHTSLLHLSSSLHGQVSVTFMPLLKIAVLSLLWSIHHSYLIIKELYLLYCNNCIIL